MTQAFIPMFITREIQCGSRFTVQRILSLITITIHFIIAGFFVYVIISESLITRFKTFMRRLIERQKEKKKRMEMSNRLIRMNGNNSLLHLAELHESENKSWKRNWEVVDNNEHRINILNDEEKGDNNRDICYICEMKFSPKFTILRMKCCDRMCHPYCLRSHIISRIRGEDGDRCIDCKRR